MPAPPETPNAFEAFRQIVLAHPALLEQFRATPDVAAFVARVRETAEPLGFSFTDEDVHAALRASQRAWIERWI